MQPDLTLLLDLPESVAKSRRQQRAGAEAVAEDRFEQEGSAFFQRVREAYLERARLAPERIVIIDASQSIASVKKDIDAVLDAFVAQQGTSQRSAG